MTSVDADGISQIGGFSKSLASDESSGQYVSNQHVSEFPILKDQLFSRKICPTSLNSVVLTFTYSDTPAYVVPNIN